MITARLSSKNQVVVPAAVRKRLDIHAGDLITFTIESDGVRLSGAASGRRHYDLQELVDLMRPENRHELLP